MNELIDELIQKIKKEVIEEIKKESLFFTNYSNQNDSNTNSYDTTLLSYKEASEEYKISITTLKKFKKQGLIFPDLKGGRTLLFRRKTIENCLLNRPRCKPSFIKENQ